MIGFGPMGSGAGVNSSSSTSNLSALAPPFTVDRSNPKPNPNPNLHYPEPPYTAEPYSHGWPYASPSSPVPEVVFDSTGRTMPPLSDDQTVSPTSIHWSALNSGNKPSSGGFAYVGGEVKPYCSPYVPSLVGGEKNLLAEDVGSRYSVGPTSGPIVKSQIDYNSSLWNVDYGATWVDNLGFDAGKRAKRVELDGSFIEKANLGGSHNYGNQLNQGGFGTEKNKSKSTETSGVSYQKLNQASDREIHTGSSSAAQMENKSSHEQNLGYFPYNPIKTDNPAYSSTYPKPYRSVLSSDMHKSCSNGENSLEKCVKPIHKPFIGPVSAMMPSPKVVIRPPPATNAKYGQRNFSRKPARFDKVESLDLGPKSNSQIKEDSFETNYINNPKQGNNGLISLTPVKEHSCPLRFRDSFDCQNKARLESLLPDVNIFGGFNMACDNNVRVINSVENLSDCVDHQSTAVDSPCWKGASSSRFSSVDIESGGSNNMKKNIDEYYQSFQSVMDSSRAFLEKAGESNKNFEKHEYGGSCSSKEHSLLCDAKGIETSNGLSIPGKQAILVNNIISDGVKMSLNDVSEGAIAVHAAEKVLASPASQEDATGRTVIQDRKLNVRTVLKAMRNLSELLLFHVPNDDACSLEGKHTETIENIVSNLRSYVNNKTLEASTIKKPETNNHVEHTCDQLRADMSTTLGSPHRTNKAPDYHIKLDCQHMLQEEINCSFSGKKDEKSPKFSPLGDDLDVMKDDDMTKAIKKVLEVNFHLNEEMNLQALLFKNLWLDAEAKLCSITYKARFDRMKNQMEHFKIMSSRDNEGTEEVASQVCISPDSITGLSPKAQIPRPNLHDVSISSAGGPTDGIEGSVMARFNILKSREENVKPLNTEDQQKKPEMVDGEHDHSIAARLNILRSREEKLLKSFSLEEGIQSKMVDGEFFSDKYVGPCTVSRSEGETSNVGLKMARSGGGCLNEGKMCSYLCGDEYEALDEFHLSNVNDPIIHPLKNSSMIDQNNVGRRDSPSSDWEHVFKDDFSWKTL